MTRGTLAFDRVMTALAGAGLLALGVVGILWWAGRLGSAPTRVDLSGIRWWATQQWWPWALVVGGVVLALVGLRWLFSHLPRSGVSHLTLPGSGSEGRLLVATGPAVDAAAGSLEQAPGVRSVRGRIDHDRGQVVASFVATIDRDADLRLVAAAVDEMTGRLQSVLERQDVYSRVVLRTTGRSRKAPRVY